MNLRHIDFHNPTLVECIFKLQISNICLYVYCLLQMLFAFQVKVLKNDKKKMIKTITQTYYE